MYIYIYILGGPAFDYTYYNTYTAVVGSLTGWLGIVLFQVLLLNLLALLVKKYTK